MESDSSGSAGVVSDGGSSGGSSGEKGVAGEGLGEGGRGSGEKGVMGLMVSSTLSVTISVWIGSEVSWIGSWTSGSGGSGVRALLEDALVRS